MFTLRSITVGLVAALAVVASPLVATASPSLSPSVSAPTNVNPMGTSDYPWGP